MKKVFLSLIKLPQFITLPLFLCLLLTLRLLLDLYLEISYSINEIVFKYGLTIATGEIFVLLVQLFFDCMLLKLVDMLDIKTRSKFVKCLILICASGISMGVCFYVIFGYMDVVWYSDTQNLLWLIPYCLVGGFALFIGLLLFLMREKKKEDKLTHGV